MNDFLERYLDVRWLMPTDLGTDVPKHQTIEIPDTKIMEQPVFLARGLSPGKGTNPLSTWEHFNRSRLDRISFSHNLLKLFPVSKYGKTHPEFYPIINGKRYIPSSDSDHRWQPNFSAPGLVDAAVQEIDAYFQKYPERMTYSLGINDSDNWDETGAYNNGDGTNKADVYFAWANAVVEKVLLKHPDKWFGTLGYWGMYQPPTKVKVHPRIIPFLTADRLRWNDVELRAAGEEHTQKWADASQVLGWYDYIYGRSYLLPRVYSHSAQQYLSWGVAHNVKFSYAELYPNWGEGPKPWIYTRLLWNPNQDVDALMDDWCRHFAGDAAAPQLKQYFAIWEKFWTKDILKTEWTRNANIYHKGYLPFDKDPTYLLDVPQAYITQSDATMQAALRLADSPQRKARVAKLKEMWDFYKASIITYQGEHLSHHTEIKTEQQALDLLNKAEGVLEQIGKRQQLLAAFFQDPLYADSADYMTRSADTAGGSWGASLLWSVQAWAQKSPLVKARVQQLAQSSNKSVREQADIFLQVINRNFTQISPNASFENGQKGWRFWDKADEIATYQRGVWAITTDKSYSGTHGLSIKGLQRGGPVQTVPYKAGRYLARAYCYVPKNSKVGNARLTLSVTENGETNKEIPLPSSNIQLQAGKWASVVIPFILPDAKNSAAMRVSLVLGVDGFQPDGQIYLDNIGIYRIDENK